MAIPALFDRHGNFVELSPDVVGTMPVEIFDAYTNVKTTAEQLTLADAAVAAARKRVTNAVSAERDAQQTLDHLRPRMTAVEAARQFIRTEQMKRGATY